MIVSSVVLSRALKQAGQWISPYIENARKYMCYIWIEHSSLSVPRGRRAQWSGLDVLTQMPALTC